MGLSPSHHGGHHPALVTDDLLGHHAPSQAVGVSFKRVVFTCLEIGNGNGKKLIPSSLSKIVGVVKAFGRRLSWYLHFGV